MMTWKTTWFRDKSNTKQYIPQYVSCLVTMAYEQEFYLFHISQEAFVVCISDLLATFDSLPASKTPVSAC